MSGSYKQCSECGKRALSIATRCPGCAREFPPRPERSQGLASLGRFLTPRAVAGVLATGGVLLAAVLGVIRRAPLEEETSSVTAPARLEMGRTAASLGATAGATGERLIARTWTKVRNRRSTAGNVDAVLLPGDTVVADSLSQGWWRVALDGEVLGYVHESTLMADGAAVKP